MSELRLAASALVLAFASGLTAAAETVTGTAIYRERIMPPPDARFVAVLSDISRADAPAIELGRIEIENAGGPPYAFAIEYDPADIDQKNSYAVRATLFSSEQMMFTTDTVAPVLTRDASNEVNIVMARVASQAPKIDADPARIGAHGLQLPATFTGTLPCASCEGIRYHLDLWPGQGYHLRREWLGSDSITKDEVGFWYGDPQRNAIALSGTSETSAQWEVKAPDRIRHLDTDGNAIESDLPYELTSTGTLDETDVEGVLLGGMMTYMADAAVFQECRTGREYPIVQDDNYLALERAYLADQSAAGAPLYVNVEGALLMRPGMEGPDQRSIVVDRFVRTRPGITCERQRADASLTNTYWRIDTLLDENVPDLQPGSQEPHLILRGSDENRFFATVGCNGMTGGYTRQDERLSFEQVAATKMACPPPLDTLEQGLAQALSAIHGYDINGETLVLYGEESQVIGIMTAVYLR